MNRKFRYPGQHDREEIERLHSRGATVAVIADKIGAHTAPRLHSGHLSKILRIEESGRGRNDRNRLLYHQKGSEKMDKK